jgi:hypothetical protein
MFRVIQESALRFVRVIILVVVVTQPLISSVQFWNIPERFPLRVALGLESREAFLRRALNGYRAALYLNQVSRPDEKVLGAGTENLRFYLRSRLETLSISLLDSPVRILAVMAPGPELLAELKRAGFRHLLITRDSLQKPTEYVSYLDRSFLEHNGRLEFSDEYVLVFRLF